MFLAVTASLEAQVPTIDSISPNAALTGSSGFTLTVSGGTFLAGAVVRWNGANRATTLVSSGMVTAAIPASDLVGLDAVAITVANAGQVSNVAIFNVYRTLPITAKDLIYDRYSRKIYASIPGSAPNGNSILPIDPFTLTTGTAVPIGSEPGKLAISDNGQYLYVALDGSGAVRRMDLASQTAGLQFSLGNGDNGASLTPYFVDDLEVMPGSPTTIAVSRRYGYVNSHSEGVAIYDDDVKRPTESSDSSASSSIAFGSSSVLYGYVIGGPLRAMNVAASGVTVTTSSNTTVKGTEIKFDSGRNYSSAGSILNAQTFSPIATIVSISGANTPISVLPDAAFHRLFYLSTSNSTTTNPVISVVESDFFNIYGNISISESGVSQIGSLVRWGDEGLAFRTPDKIVFVRIPPAWLTSTAPLSISALSAIFSVQPVGTTSNPQTITLTNNTNTPLTISGIVAGGDFAQTNNCGSSIAALSNCTISVTFTPTAQGSRAGTISINDSTAGNPHVVGLVGVGDSSFAVPSITTINPTAARVGSAGLTLTVTGKNFVPASIVRWNGLDRPTTFNSSTSLSTMISSTDLTGLETANVSVFTPPPDGGLSNAASFAIYRSLALPANDLIYDRFSRRLFSTVSGQTTSGNSITPIDPFTASVGSPITVGSEPAKLAISDNGQSLYVALTGAAAVRQVDLSTQTAGLQFAAGNDSFDGPISPTDLAVMPGNSQTVAVVRTDFRGSPFHGAIAIFDNGIPRPNATPFFSSTELEYSNSASKLYSYNDLSGFGALNVDASGVTPESNLPAVKIYGANGGFKFNEGRLYDTSGAVFDTSIWGLQATFPISPIIPGTAASLVIDSAMGRAFYLRTESPYVVITGFDLSTYTAVGKIYLSGVAPGTSLVRWGEDGLAFASGTAVVLVRIPKSWFSAGSPLTINPGGIVFPIQPVGSTSAPRTVTITNNTNATIALNGISTSGDFLANSNCGSSLNAFANCAITITFTPTAEGTSNGSLMVGDNAATGPHLIWLSGVGNGSIPSPTITGILPNSAAFTSPGLTVHVGGINFVASSIVRWNGQDRPTTFISSTRLDVSISTTDLSALASATITVFNPPPDGGLSNGVNFTIYRTLNLTTADLLYEKTAAQIYASIPASAQNGNSITTINPLTAAIGPPISIGTDPGRMAISSDSQVLYVTLNGRSTIRIMDIPTQTPGVQFNLGSHPTYGPYLVSDMAVLPGNPSAVAIARYFPFTSPSEAGVTVYDTGVKRPTETSAFFDSDAITFSGSASVLYGQQNSSPWVFQTMSVDSNGVSITNSQNGLLSGMIRFESGRVYSSGGGVADPVTRTLVGSYSVGAQFFSAVIPDVSLGRAFFLTRDSNGFAIRAYDLKNFTLIGILPLSTAPCCDAGGFLRWGDQGLAFRTSNQVFLLQIPLSWLPPSNNRRRDQVTSQ